MTKIAIYYNGKSEMYRAYRYSWMFRIFGTTFCTWVAAGSTVEHLIEETKKQIYGKLTFIRIVEI